MEEMNQLKVFTVEEANKLLPGLTPKLGELREKRDSILNLEVEIDTLELVSEKSDSNDPSPALNKKMEEYTRSVNRFYAVVDEIHETGCFLKDVDAGLVDFYGLHQGKVVYLCWKLGEPQVAYWHEVGQGYANRLPIFPDKHSH